MFKNLVTRINNRFRRYAIRIAPEMYLYTSEGYVIQIDMHDGTVFFVDPDTGAILTES